MFWFFDIFSNSIEIVADYLASFKVIPWKYDVDDEFRGDFVIVHRPFHELHAQMSHHLDCIDLWPVISSTTQRK